MRFIRQTVTIAWKDLKAEIRSKETVNASLSFAIVILLLFSFAFEPTSEVTEDITGRPVMARLCIRGSPGRESKLCARPCRMTVWMR